ncbi:MAG: sugar ABC transporter ATP-binding protein [Ruthenibacterium sp.]
MEQTILALKNITKRFAGVVALDDVSLEMKVGEVRALVGENGAGKSTLIKIIAGAHLPSSGDFYFCGEKITNMTPAKSRDLGIGVIYQEHNLMPQLTVAENIFYGRELQKGWALDKKRMLAQCRQMIGELGIDIDPSKKVRELSIAEQQIIEIVKAVSRDIKFLIMDEPTAPLTNNEIEKMFAIIDKLKEKKISILYISHRLEEIFHVSDTVTVLRDGKHITTMPTEQTNRTMLIKYMVGRDVGQNFPQRSTPVGDTLLRVDSLTNKHVHNCSFSLRQGEILGFSGLVGAGRTELMRAIFGADKTLSGKVTFQGKVLHIQNPKQAISHGIGLITEDRKSQGLLLNKGIDYNITYASLASVSKCGVIRNRCENAVTSNYMDAMNIKAHSKTQLVRTLSGGNQQKVVLGKWLATDSDVLIFDEPTRGIDVGAKHEIYLLMRQLSENGKTIIMISSEMVEVIGMCDRVLVMRSGTIVGELTGKDVTQENILEMAAE